MRVNATAKIRIEPTEEVVSTVKVYTKALQFCINTAWNKKIINNIKLHPFVYRNLRGRGLQSQLAIACIKQACGIVKKAKSEPIIKRASVRYNFNRSASFKNNVLSISTIKGRQKFNFITPDCYKEYFTWTVRESLLRIDRKGRCFFLFTFSKEVTATEQNIHSHGVLGIDLGVNNLAVTSDNRFYTSAKVKQTKRKYMYLRARLQAKGTKSAKRLLKKLYGRERRFMANVNHCISKDIVSNFSGSKIIMENLKGIRKANRGRRINYWISNWSFFQLQSFIEYKAELRGMEVVRVKPNYTSQICHRCGKLGSRSKGCFSCSHCGLSNYNSDLNASRNLAHPKLVERQAAVNQPYITCNDAKGTSQSVVEAECSYKPRISMRGS